MWLSGSYFIIFIAHLWSFTIFKEFLVVTLGGVNLSTLETVKLSLRKVLN